MHDNDTHHLLYRINYADWERLLPVEGTSIITTFFTFIILVFKYWLQIQQDASTRLHLIQGTARHCPD